MPRSSSHGVREVGIWRLRHSTLLDEAEQGDIAFGCMAVEPQVPMPSFGDHAAGPTLGEAAEQRSRSVEQEPEHRKPGPLVLRTGTRKAAG
jgi:hypothetical protein